MTERRQLQVDLPKEEADSLEARARMQRLPLAKYLGYHILRSYRGLLHPEVRAFEQQADLGQPGSTEKP